MLQRTIGIGPSILSADFGRLTEEVAEVEAAGADSVHVDVMDGRFVPNITVGLPVVRAVSGGTKLPVDVHLMIVEPERYVERFVEAGADSLSVHIEACTHAQRTLSKIRELGKRAGLVLNPHTTEDCLRYLLDDLDFVLLMTVNPGYGGQKFLPVMLDKIQRTRELIDRSGKQIDIQLDGGINPETIGACASAGANLFVTGDAVFGQPDRAAAIAELRRACRG